MSSRRPAHACEGGAGSSVSPLDALDARLASLRRRMVEGLPARADEFETASRNLEAGDAAARESIQRAAHKLRGTAASYGLTHLGALSAALEDAARSEAADVNIIQSARALAAAIRETARKVFPEAEASAPFTSRPAQTTTPGPTTTSLPALPASKLEGLTALVAEDDDATRRLLELTLTQVGRMQARVFDGAFGLLEELASRQRVDLVLIDAMMPGMNGRELIEALAERDLGQRVGRLVVLSAASIDELGWRLPDGVAVTWLRKPFRPNELLEVLTILAGGLESKPKP